MVALAVLADRAIDLSNDVLLKAGTVRYVRIKGGGRGGLDRVRLRNGMAAPPGFVVERGDRGGLFFDVAPDVDLNALEAAAQNANGGGQMPAGVAQAPRMRGQPKRVANQPVQPQTPKPQRSPNTVGGTSAGGWDKRIDNLRAFREAVAPKKRKLQAELADMRQQMAVVIGEVAAGRNITRNMQGIRIGADRAEVMARDLVAIQQEFQEKDEAVQEEKRRKRGALARRYDRDVRHQQRLDDWEQNRPLGSDLAAAMAALKKPRRTLKPDEIEQVQTLHEAGLSEKPGIHGDETFVATVRPGTFDNHGNLSDTRVCFKSLLPHPGWEPEADNEVGSSVISDVLGWDICPETVHAKAKVGNGFREGSAQRWSDDSGFGGKVLRADKYLAAHPGGGAVLDPNNVELRQSYMKMWVFDMVIGNTDRHDGNLCIDEDNNRVWAIDNGYALARWKRDAGNYHDNHIINHVRGRGMVGIDMDPSPEEKKYLKGLIAHAIRMEPVLTAAVAKECPDGLQSFKSRMKALRTQRI